MKISHHLDEATIMAYAAGTLPAALQVVAASHIAWCKSCREKVRLAEAVGAQELGRMAPAKMAEGALDRALDLLDEVEAVAPRAIHRPMADTGLPGPLAEILGGRSLEELNWRKVVPGIQFHDIKMREASGGTLRLMKVAAGKSMPEHGHGGEELTLILRGAYEDEIGTFGIGDVADLDETVEHRPVVTADADCICVVATQAQTRFKSLTARMLQPLIGI